MKYKIINDEGEQYTDNTFKYKREAIEFLKYNYNCLKRDGFLEDYNLKEFFNDYYIEVIKWKKKIYYVYLKA